MAGWGAPPLGSTILLEGEGEGCNTRQRKPHRRRASRHQRLRLALEARARQEPGAGRVYTAQADRSTTWKTCMCGPSVREVPTHPVPSCLWCIRVEGGDFTDRFHATEDQGCQPDGGTSEEVSRGEQVVRWESISVYLMHGDGITVPRHSPEMDERAYPEMDEISQLPSSGQWLSRARLWCTGITPRVAAHPVPNAA